jgi:hypothetical protein
VAQRLAFKLEPDLDEGFELPGWRSKGFEQRMTELWNGGHDCKECRRQPSFLGLDARSRRNGNQACDLATSRP